MTRTVGKGDRVRARWFEADPKASLAGMQLKFSTSAREVVGVVKHIRGDKPVAPTKVAVAILPDGEKNLVWIRSEWIVEVLS